MGPIRGLRKKKKLERKLNSNGTASDSSKKDDAIDWWDDFSKRTNERIDGTTCIGRFDNYVSFESLYRKLDRGSRFGFDALVFNL
ncbi:putative nuclease HARBI1 [Cucumis melo var. makuwa]|uniref:Nuclease HARBI1 n=1 Tax=Cucumis melo var. makuwa TaxID=1194695 RepID=A0A5A7VJS1_CUCMM|nr:putative nuclease HARBI1 [Cucumis melo var. makuwa]TYK26547.1 putative nuclease HARBI1 [Cucumis melo var. makuwa]